MNEDPDKDFIGFWYEQAAWSNKVFGDESKRGPIGPAKHLLKEVQEELIPAILEGRLEDAKEEVVDTLFLVVDTARRLRLDPYTIIERAFGKLEVNRKREWPAPTTDEPVEHVRNGKE